ncbi:GYF domain-containing protein [Lysobacter sp. LF1]|uniref:GYF domain-containing protein n=1 Tax=Lysobacter stagni TaxID=3045172 RepID=A0ABT6XDZ4_9GAMM|nr:GYF domain-containing protein [Lysobacter sp. LF1]MDI9238362.1 GYF domain-containing protein [Lysobacter sp. LF1]
MTDWYYHDPARGRVGPHTADEMRKRFRERLIQRDTLVWHAALPEWQPLDRQIIELDLAGVQPDASLPPPLPPVMPRATPAASRPMPGARRTASERKRGLSGCAIALIVVAALTVPMVGILAAIAVPAYRDYTVRAKLVQLYPTAVEIEHAVDAHVANHGRCPGNDAMVPVLRDHSSLPASSVEFGESDGRCGFLIQVGDITGNRDGHAWMFTRSGQDDPTWDCTGGDLPTRFRPRQCRPSP